MTQKKYTLYGQNIFYPAMISNPQKAYTTMSLQLKFHLPNL